VPGFYLVLTPEMRRHVQRYLTDRYGRPSGVDSRDRAK
jgi:hypothetical protein